MISKFPREQALTTLGTYVTDGSFASGVLLLPAGLHTSASGTPTASSQQAAGPRHQGRRQLRVQAAAREAAGTRGSDQPHSCPYLVIHSSLQHCAQRHYLTSCFPAELAAEPNLPVSSPGPPGRDFYPSSTPSSRGTAAPGTPLAPARRLPEPLLRGLSDAASLVPLVTVSSAVCRPKAKTS